MADEEKQSIDVLAANVTRAIAATRDSGKQVRILCDNLREKPVMQGGSLMLALLEGATKDFAHAKAFLSLLDQESLKSHLGSEQVQKYQKVFKNDSRFERLKLLFDKTEGIDKAHIDVVKAKVAFLLQLLYLLRDRLLEEGMPQSTYDAVTATVDMVDSTMGAEDARQILRVDMSHFGGGYRHIVVEFLKEADFREAENDQFELVLSESLIRQYADGSALVNMESGENAARMSEALLARMGENLVKRLSLLARTVSMYPADHPGIAPMVDSLVDLLSALLVEKEQITLSRLGTDLLLADAKIKKKNKALQDFAIEMEERNLNSITFKKNTGVEEMRTFVFLFSKSPRQIKKQGGVKGILDKKGVSHILVDQFKYGIIADDGSSPEEQITDDEKTLETVVLTEVLTRMKEGKGLGDMSSVELGEAFRSLVSGGLKGDKQVRKTLAQMIMMLDPELMDKAIFDKGIVREELSWSSARRMVDNLLQDLEDGDSDVRQSAVTHLGQLADVAITRNKETTLSLIIERLSKHLWVSEKDLDVNQKIFEALTALTQKLVQQNKVMQVHSITKLFKRFVDYCDNLPADRRDLFTRAMSEMAGRSLAQIPDEEVVTFLTDELAGDDTQCQEMAKTILQHLASDPVVEGLLQLFLHTSRSVRNRAFQVLTNMGRPALKVCAEKLRNLNDRELFERDGSGILIDEAWYIARNCIDIVGKIGEQDHVDLIRSAADDSDYRVRREALTALSRFEPKEAIFLSRLKLNDKEPDVVEAAISTLGNLQARDHVDDLVEVLFVDERYRSAVIKALSKIGGEKAESILLAALNFKGDSPAAKVFADDFQLRSNALGALGQIGGPRSDLAFKRFLIVWKNPILRLIRMPLRSHLHGKKLVDVVTQAQNRLQYRLQKKSAD